MFYWGEAIIAYEEAEVIEKTYADKLSQQLNESEEELSKDFLKTANISKTDWSVKTAWYKAKERTAAALFAKEAAKDSKSSTLKTASLRCTKEAAASWSQAVQKLQEILATPSEQSQIDWSVFSLEDWQKNESEWNQLVTQQDKGISGDILVASPFKKAVSSISSVDSSATGGVASGCVSFSPSESNRAPAPLDGLSEEERAGDGLPEEERAGKARFSFIEGQEITENQEPNRKTHVRIIEASSGYRHIRTEEVIDKLNNHVISQRRMLADQLILTPGSDFNEVDFREKMGPEIIALRKEELFGNPFYLLEIAGYRIDSLPNAQKKIKDSLSSGVNSIEPVFFLSSSGNKHNKGKTAEDSLPLAAESKEDLYVEQSKTGLWIVKRREDNKIMKPLGWTAPDLKQLF